jgi:hypothetical protein
MLVDTWPHADLTPRDVVRYGPNRMRETKVAREALAMPEMKGWLVPLQKGSV